jgi:hypothetical protein
MLSESSVPKAVLKSGGECDSIQKSLWILCKKIKFSTTSVFQIDRFKNLQEMINILMIMKFPLIISVMGTHACHHHVVVIWRGMIINYESKYTFPLTNDSSRQISGVNTTLLVLVVVMEYFHRIIFITPWTIFSLRIGESTNITSKAVLLGIV